MLTVKHIIWNGGFETLYQAKQIRVKYPDRKPGALPPYPEFVAFDLPNDEVFTIRFGKVYVMNETGKTVGSYDLGTGADAPSANCAPPSSPDATTAVTGAVAH